MIRLLLLNSIIVTLPLFALQQADIRIGEYSVRATINAERSTVEGSASVWLQVSVDSIDRFRFVVPAGMSVNAVRDIDDDRYTEQRSEITSLLHSHIVELPSHRYRNDSFFVSIEFESVLDSASTAPMFINGRECILPFLPGTFWLPRFEADAAARASLQLIAPAAMTVFGGFSASDSVIDDEYRSWTFANNVPTGLRDMFTVCGSVAVREIATASPDSSVSVSFFIDTTRFHGRLADSLLAFLFDAAQFFKNRTGKTTDPFVQRYIVAGNSNMQEQIYRAGNAVIDRYSPAFTVYDSLMFTRSTKNSWLLELARSFCPPSVDSTALFDEGWAGYLATTYILQRYRDPSVERRERLDLMINALSFYPTNPLAAGRTQRSNERDVLSFKGRYFFLMVEHVIGNGSFAAVMRSMYGDRSGSMLTINEFRLLCEREYGSSLEQFFRQWLYGSGVPEFVIQWRTETTRRGTTQTTVTVEQRGELFSLPITLAFTIGNRVVPKRIHVDKALQTFSFLLSSAPTRVEIDPNFSILRWIIDVRILAHAYSSRLFRVYDRDVSNAEREALLTLELDPVNATGSAPIAYFSLGKLSVIEGDREQAKEYFVKAMQSFAVEESALYPLLSLVRFANILEMEGRRTEAIAMYERAITEGYKNPSLYTPAIVEAERYLLRPFVSSDALWFGLY
jgi:hypothetical protein